MRIRQLIARWWPTALVVAVILYATLDSDPVGVDSFPLIPHLDKLIHAIMFGGLFASISFDSRRAGHRLSTKSLLTFAAISIAAGAIDEVLQHTIANGRDGDILDWAADSFGIAVAYFTAPPVINNIFKHKHTL
ncbi:MAG: VanZ family protein [Muribaculaceae bacterium]|nr:VanZ family protein [Muribaculaceae bacterium]MDE6526205.1 VanZ family protein [Muribaculaceae bacterium]MDE6611355.1 VanZ family protein [Muribaculaceae bacterium]